MRWCWSQKVIHLHPPAGFLDGGWAAGMRLHHILPCKGDLVVWNVGGLGGLVMTSTCRVT